MHSNQRDPHLRTPINQGRTTYSPNPVGGRSPMAGAEGCGHFPASVSGVRQRFRSQTFAGHFSQATLFDNSQPRHD